MTKVIANTISLTGEYKSVISRFILAISAFVIVLYGINVYSAISKAAAIKRIDTMRIALENKVQQLDAQYIALSGKVSPEMAEQYGLVEVPVAQYINRSGSLGIVSRNSEL